MKNMFNKFVESFVEGAGAFTAVLFIVYFLGLIFEILKEL